MTQSLIFVSVVDHEEQSQLLLRPLNSARPAQNTGQTRRKKDIVSLRTSSHILIQQMQQIVLALVIWVATVTSRGHPEKTFSKIIPRFSAKIFLKIAPALANHGHSRYELLHLNPWRQGHKDLCDCVWTTNLERRTLLQWKDARSQNILWLYTYDFCKSSALTFGMQFDAIEIEDARFWGKWGT